MDPTETLRSLDRAIQVCDYATAVECLNNYYQWRVKGGFEPTVRWKSGSDAKGDQCADTLATQLADKLEGLS